MRREALLSVCTFCAFFTFQIPCLGQEGDPGSPVLKPGWTDVKRVLLANACTVSTAERAKQGYVATGRVDNKSLKPISESEIEALTDKLCACISWRIALSWSDDEFSAHSREYIGSVMDEALAGGRCKPESALGRMLQ